MFSRADFFLRRKNLFINFFYSKKKREIVAVLQRSNKSLGDIKKYLEENLPQYMIPKKIILINNFPLTPNEKIDYKKIIHKYE